jgi:extradiol dioxygenase family protein
MAPILHLSLPVRDLDAARAFYVEVLGCAPGRVRDGWADVWFHGMQLTLQERPEQVLPDDQRGVRHFGVALDRDQLDALVARIERAGVRWLSPLTTDDPGTDREQTKATLLDPSGNAIELKSYADPASALSG